MKIVIVIQLQLKPKVWCIGVCATMSTMRLEKPIAQVLALTLLGYMLGWRVWGRFIIYIVLTISIEMWITQPESGDQMLVCEIQQPLNLSTCKQPWHL